MLDLLGNLHIELQTCNHLEILVCVTIVLHNWKERVILTEIKSLLYLSVGNAQHQMLLNIDIDLHLGNRVLLNAYLASNYNSFVISLLAGTSPTANSR